jgi:hypothetical protein
MASAKNAGRSADVATTDDDSDKAALARVVEDRNLFSDDELRNVGSFDDALRLIAEAEGISVLDISDFGSGFAVEKDKDNLCGKRFIILNYRFHLGKTGEFVILQLVTEDGQKLVLTDGGTGIYAQMCVVRDTNRGKKGAIMVPRGLVRSDYVVTDSKGNEIDATTYYLSLSK